MIKSDHGELETVELLDYSHQQAGTRSKSIELNDAAVPTIGKPDKVDDDHSVQSDQATPLWNRFHGRLAGDNGLLSESK